MIASLFKKHHRFSLSRALAVTIALAGLTTQGCIGDDEITGSAGGGDELIEQGGTPRPSVKVYVRPEGGEYELLEIRAGERERVETSRAETQSIGRDGRVQKEQAVDLGDRDVGLISSPFDYFLMWIGQECRREHEANLLPTPPPFAKESLWPNGRPFPYSRFQNPEEENPGVMYFPNSAAWYNVNVLWATGYYGSSAADVQGALRSCDHVLYLQSQLLCTANKLSEIAEATGAVRFSNLKQQSQQFDMLIPPQATADRQILRRLVLDSLAALGQLGSETLDSASQTCSALYGAAIEDPEAANNATNTPLYFHDRQTLPSADTFSSLIRSKVRTWVENHRAALMLLHKTNQSMVEAGLAVAYEMGGRNDFQEMWGNKRFSVDLSLRAVLARQLGRLEVDPYRAYPPGEPITVGGVGAIYAAQEDPTCSGRASLRDMINEEDVIGEFEGFLQARAADVPPRTIAQQRAQVLVERLGLVVPTEKADSASEAQLRTLLREQLARLDHHTLLQDSPTLELDAVEAERGPAYDAMLKDLGRADIAFALRGGAAVFAQLAEREWPLPSPLPSSERGIERWSDLSGPTLSALEGGVYSVDASRPAGLPRAALAADPTAMVLRAQASSQCAYPSHSQAAMNRALFAYQSPADLATRLVDHMTSPMSASGLELEELQEFDRATLHSLQVARAEYFGNEAVDGLKHVDILHTTSSGSAEWHVRLHANEASLPAGATLDEMEIALVYGRPWEAACLAGSRTACGPAFVPRHRLAPVEGGAEAKTVNVFGQSSRMWKFHPQAGTTLPIVTRGIGDPLLEEILYVVRLPGALPGRVLAGFKPLPATSTTAIGSRGMLMSLSRSRNEAVHRVLSTSGGLAQSDRCVEGRGSARPEESCVAGIFDNQYVPLSNELTTDGSGDDTTWRHYLELARSSAVQADELGQQLISQGLQRDLRIEGAQEELAALCGTFVDPGNVDLSSGTGESFTESDINACVSPETSPLVFLQAGTGATVTPTEASVRLVQYCKVHAEGPLCDLQEDLVALEALGPVSLGLPPPPGPELGQTIPGCQPTKASAVSVMGGNTPGTEDYQQGVLAGFVAGGPLDTQGFRSLLTTEPFTRAGLAGAVAKLNYTEHDLADPVASGWELTTMAGIPLLAGVTDPDDVAVLDTEDEPTAAEKAWPLCRRIAEQSTINPCSELALRVERSFMGDADYSADQTLDDRVRRGAEAALWTMARLTGHVPAGLFAKVIPVANYGADASPLTLTLARLQAEFATALTWFPMSAGFAEDLLAAVPDIATFEAPVPTIYSYGAFQQTGDQFTLIEGHSPADRETLGALRRLPPWYLTHGLDLGQRQKKLVKFFEEGTNGEYSADMFLGLRVGNASLSFDGGPEKGEPTENVAGVVRPPLYGVEDWLAAALGPGELSNPAFESIRRGLMTGNRPGGAIDLVRDGILYSHVVARPNQCGQEAKDANLGDFLPEHAGMQAGDGAYIYKSLGDSWPKYPRDPVARAALSAKDGDPADILRDNGEDGYYLYLGILFTDLAKVPYANNGQIVDAQRGVPHEGRFVWPRIWGRYSHDGRVRLQQEHDGELGGSGDTGGPGCQEYDSEFTADLLSAAWWPPSKRVHMFIDPGASAAENVAFIGALSCLAETSLNPSVSLNVPEIANARQIPLIREWIEGQAQKVAEWQGTLHLTEVPTSVLDHFSAGTANHAEVGAGEKGQQTLALAQAMVEVHSGFTAVYDGIRRAGAAVRDAETALAGADLSGDAQLQQIAMQRTQTIGNMVKGSIAMVGGFGAAIAGIADPAGAIQSITNSAMGAVDMAVAGEQLGQIGELETITEDLLANSSVQILQRMSDSAAAAMADVQQGILQIRTAHINVLRAQNALASVTGNARFQLAKASGADFMDLNGDAEAESMPVNTVFRRSYDVLQRRYEAALNSAKRYAYLARLSIEQKLGVRLAEIDEAVGPVPPPRTWANSVCSLSGIDYEKLRKAADPDKVDEEEQLIDDFADQYIGDYVRQLEEFVEFYNVRYPFRDEDDAAVLSLRDDLVYGDKRCRRVARNLLYFSDRLASGPFETDAEDPYRSLGGWRVGPAYYDADEGLGARLHVQEAVEKPAADHLEPVGEFAAPYPTPDAEGYYTETAYLEPPTDGAGVSILRVDAVPQEPWSVEVGPVPPLSTYQTVSLFGGTLYFLSWRDMARSAAGGPAVMGAEHTYRVMVTDSNWFPIAIADPTAEAGDDDTWSERRLLPVYVEQSGDYHVVISPVTTGLTGAVAIANVQLEAAQFEGPQAFEATTGTREINAFDCGKGNGKMLRDSFVRRCDTADSCYYELAKPISLHEGRIASGDAMLPGLAADNFNYRHGNLAVNVVGTGVLDCSNADQSCFAQGFLEYDLVHSAFNAELRDHADQPRCFNFGRGTIRHAKALVAERYLGVPMSSTDREFMETNEFMKRTLRDRPLSGQYYLRIYETPELRWEQIEDIQLYLQYGYWSRVENAQ